MANLHSTFMTFYDDLQITDSKVKAIVKSRNHLRELIKKYFNDKYPDYTVGFWIQGSWKMKTTIRKKDDHCDLDDGVYIFPGPNVVSTTVKGWVQKAVDGVTDATPKHKNKCIRVEYKGGYHIDLPVYVKEHFDRDTEPPKLATTQNGYIESDPKQLVDWFSEKKKNNEQLVRIISYIKAWCDDVCHSMPSGLAVTILASNNQVKDQRDDVALVETLKAIRTELDNDFTCIVPAVPYDDVLKDFIDNKDTVLEEFNRIIDYGEKAMAEKNLLKASRYWKHALGDRFPEAEDKDDPEMKLKELRNYSSIVLGGEAKINRQGHIQTNEGVANQPHRFYGEK